MSGRHPKWARENTHYRLPRSPVPVDVDGFKKGEPFGIVVCEECDAAAYDIEDIDHDRVDGDPCPNDPDVE
jgi:hypothetical protein